VIIVDRALEKRAAAGQPVQVAMVGAGFMGRGIALQIITAVPGLRLAVVANRHLDEARRAYAEAGVAPEDVCVVETETQLQAAIERGQYAVTGDALLVCRAASIEAVVEVTGAIEHGAHVALTAIEHGKHIIMMNAELDGTIGPILKVYADRAGVIITNADGDQPGVTLNLYRFVRGLGVTPVLCGNIKGLHDPYRNPTTQEGFARRWGQRPSMVTSFADGTKISFEQAIVANATGMRVGQRGMFGPVVPPGTPLPEAVKAYSTEALCAGPGLVDYLVGAEPAPGVFVLGTHTHPRQQHYLNLYKLGSGPLYCFYTPYHLCHFEVPNTIGRAVLLGDATITPKAGPCVDVVAAAKVDLAAGQTLDGLGCYMTYGLAENSDTVRAEDLLPIGLAEGCRLQRDIPRDQVLTFGDVALPEGRLCDRLWAEQNAHFGLEPLQPQAGLDARPQPIPLTSA
jgi:predicted homoserine dehydrogenase-like protein